MQGFKSIAMGDLRSFIGHRAQVPGISHRPVITAVDVVGHYVVVSLDRENKAINVRCRVRLWSEETRIAHLQCATRPCKMCRTHEGERVLAAELESRVGAFAFVGDGYKRLPRRILGWHRNGPCVMLTVAYDDIIGDIGQRIMVSEDTELATAENV